MAEPVPSCSTEGSNTLVSIDPLLLSLLESVRVREREREGGKILLCLFCTSDWVSSYEIGYTSPNLDKGGWPFIRLLRPSPSGPAGTNSRTINTIQWL